MKALVTGASGYLGSLLCRRLVFEGWQVHVVTRPESSMANIDDIAKSICVHEHDGSMEKMATILLESKPMVIFHLASFFLSDHKPSDIDGLIKSNVLFGTQLAEAAVRAGSLCFLNASTSWVHFLDNSYNPVNLYAATKKAFEDILKFYSESLNLKVITLTIFDTYGPGDWRPKLLNLLADAADKGTVLEMSPGDQKIDLVHAKDVVEAFMTASELVRAKTCNNIEEYGVLSGRPLSLKNIVELFERCSGKKLRIKWGERPYRHREVMVPWSKGKVLPGWTPKHDICAGISELMSYIGTDGKR